MNYEDKTKEQLIEIAKDGRHLKTAVEAKDKEINELKAKLEFQAKEIQEQKEKEIRAIQLENKDSRKNLEEQYKLEIRELKSKLYELESGVEILADRKLAELRASFEKNEKTYQKQLKEVSDIAIKKSNELEEAIEIIETLQRSFQGSLDMSINLTGYFKDKITKGGQE